MSGPISGRVRRGLRRALALASVCLLIAGVGCTGERAVASVSDPGPTRGGVLRMVQEAPRSLDPLSSDSVYESMPIRQLFDGLVSLDPSLNVVPGLAETWVVSEDGTDYTFHLRRGVRFHDGTPLAAGDVVFSVRRVLEPGRDVRSLAFSYLTAVRGAREYSSGRAAELEGVEAPDPETVSIRLSRPYPSFLQVLAMDGLAIVPERRVLEVGEADFARNPIGTGPFRLDAWHEDHLRLVANPEYFADAPYVDAVEIWFLRAGEWDSGNARFLRDELDVLEPQAEAIAKLSRDPGARIFRYQELSLSFLGLNASVPPLDIPEVRRAIAHALDRSAMVAESPSVRREAVGVLPPGIFAYSPEPKTLPHDPERARELLAQAGYPDGRGLPPVVIQTPGKSVSTRRLLDRMARELDAVGLRLEVEEVTWGQLSDALESRTSPAFLLGWVADLSDPDAFLRSLFESGGSGNFFHYEDPATDELLERGAATTDPLERARIYRELEGRVLTRAPIVPLYHSVGVVAMRPWVHNLEPGPLGMANLELERVWLDGGSRR